MKGKIIAILSLFLFFTQHSYSQCMADAGTSTVISDGNGNFPFVLCFGDMFEIVSNDDYTLPPETPPNVAGIMWGLYLCPPTDPVDPGADPCWDMSYWTGEDFPQTNDGSLVAFLDGNNTFWIAPIASDAVQLPNHDQDGDGCVDVGLGEVYQITLLDDITFNIQNIDNCNGEVTIEIMGGYPEEFPGNYTVSNTGGGNLMQSGTSGEIITITNLGNGQPYSFQVTEDGNGCSQFFNGGTMTLISEDASFLFPPFCPDEPNGPTFVATPGGTFVFNPAPGDGATINPNTGEITGATPGMTYFVEYTTGGACPTTGMPQAVMAQIVPPAPMVNPDSYIGCQGDPINVIPNGTGGNFNFYNDPGLNNLVFSGPFFNASVFVVPGVTTTFYVTESNGPCEGPATPFDVLVQPANTPTLTPNTATLCAGEPVTIIPSSNNANSTNTFNFYANAALTNLLFTGSIYTFNPTMSTTIFVTEEINGCESMPVAFTVNIEPTPPAPNVTSPVDICVNEAAPNLMANGTGGTITWYDVDPSVGNPLGIATGPTFTPPINTMVAGSATYWVTEASPAGCEGPASTITVNVNAAPAAPNAVDPPAICIGENVTPIAANGTGGTFNWYDTDPTMGNPIPIFSGNPFNPPVNTNQAGNTIFWVTETNGGGCEGSATQVTVTVNAAPAAPNAVDPASICIGEAAPNLTANGSGGILTWYDQNPVIGNPTPIGSGSPFTPVINTNIAGTFDFWVTETNGGSCESDATQVTITINDQPSAPNATDPAEICTGEAVPGLLANGSGGTLNWYDQDPDMGNPASIGTGSPFTPAINTNTTGTFDFWVTETNGAGCESAATQVTITINNGPATPMATDPAAICIGETIPTLMANGGNGTLNWYDEDPSTATPAVLGTGATFTPTINSNTAGTFDFWVTESSATGCESAPEMVSITIVAEPAAPTANDPNSICIDDPVPDLTANGSGGTLTWYDADPAMGNPASIGTGSPFMPAIDNTVAGSTTFWVTETNATGCEGAATEVIITINELPTMMVETDCAADLSSYSVQVTTDADAVNSSEGMVTDQGGGIFLVEGIDVNNDVMITAINTSTNCEFTLEVQAPDCNCPGVDAPISGGDEEICEGDQIPTLSVTVNAGETVDWYDAAVDGTLLLVGSATFTPAAAGTYYAEARTIDNNCISTRTAVTLTVNPFPSITLQELTCSADLLSYNVDIIFADADQIMVSEGLVMDNGNGSFNISGIDINNDLTIVASNSVTDCSEEFQINPINCDCPDIDAPINDGDQTICEDEMIPNLSATVGADETVDWYDAPIGGTLLLEDSNTFTPTEAGTYYAEARNTINNCISARTAIELTINPLPTIAMAETICADDLLSYDLEITMNDADELVASVGNLTDNMDGSFTLSDVPAGTDIQLTANNTQTGCSDDFMIVAPDCNCPNIDEPVSGGDRVICEGEMIPDLNATVGADETIDWYDAAIGGTLLLAGSTTFTPTEAGVYFAETRTLLDDCVSSTRTAVALTINENPSLEIIEEIQPGCVTANGSITLFVNGGTEPYTFSLDGGITTQSTETFTDLAAGAYDFIVIDDNNCSGTISTSLSPPDGVIAEAGEADELSCDQDMITLDGSASSGSGDLSYEWILDGNVVSTEAIFMTGEPGNYTLRVFVDDCEDTDEVLVVENITEVEADIQNESNLNCVVTSLILDGSNSTNNPDIIYQWLFNGAPIANANDVTYEANMAGLYTLVVLDESNGCQDSATTNLLLDEAYPVANAGQDQQLDCDTGEVTLDGSNSQAGASIVYQWYGPDGEPIPEGTSANLDVDLPGEYSLEVTDTINGCSNTALVEVIADFETPTASAGVDQVINCDENSTFLDGSGSSTGSEFTYIWTVEGAGNISSGASSLSPEVDAEGKYALLVTNTSNGCTASDTTDVFELTEIATSFAIGVNDPDCFGDTGGSISVIPEDNNIPIVYALNDQAFSGANQFFNLEPGNYTITAQDDRGCEWQTMVEINAPEELVVDLGEDQTIKLGDSIQLEALVNVADSAIQTIEWSNKDLLNCLDCLDPFTTQLNETTAFSIRVVDENGCVADDAIVIFVSKERGIYIPNGFTPNNDGINDVFMIFGGSDVVQINTFKVFDRWGETVFEQNNFQPNDPNYAWEGTFRNGQALNTSVFVYIAEVEFIDGETIIFSGDVTLIK